MRGDFLLRFRAVKRESPPRLAADAHRNTPADANPDGDGNRHDASRDGCSRDRASASRRMPNPIRGSTGSVHESRFRRYEWGLGCAQFRLGSPGTKSPTFGLQDDPSRCQARSKAGHVRSTSDEVSRILPTMVHPLIAFSRREIHEALAASAAQLAIGG